MKIGTYYYPEQWPRQQWQRDFDNIAAMGLQIVHLGEFAWFQMEPAPGDIRLDWLSDCVEMAQQRKLDVILCTPTAAPPVWLVERHPEILPVDEYGRRGRFGGRRHYSPTSPAFQEATRRIVTALADRFGNHPAIIGWQIDNEYSASFDQSPCTHGEFRRWLARKYATIENLNGAWGCPFWNTYYTDFAQILLPPSRDLGYANPHQRLDASRFWSWAFAHFNKIQADILKPRIGNRFITTNFMPLHPDCNPADMAGALKLFSWDSYPVHGLEKDHKDEAFRIGDPNWIGLTHDQMISYTGRMGLMELQPGQINWGAAPLVYPGAVRLWLWTAFAHGAEFTTTYRYRQPRFGTELFHHGLVATDGVTPSPGGRQFVQVLHEIAGLKKVPPLSEEYDPKTTVGLLFDFEQMWYFQTLPQSRRWNQPAFWTMWYGALARLGLRVKVLHPGQPWPHDLPMIVAPAVQMVDQPLIEQLQQYVAGGGHLLLTCRTGLMDRNGQLWEGPAAQPILSLIGATIDAYDCLPESSFAQVELDGQKYPWGVWADLVSADSGTRVIARYCDQFYAGAAAVIQKRHGSGLVTYCGVYAEPPFTDCLVHKLLRPDGPARPRSKKGVAPTASPLTITPLPPRVQLLTRGPYHILLNYQTVTCPAPAPPRAHFLIGNRQVEPAGVAVWEIT